MKAEFGPENVFDFSLGNPDLSPPDDFRQVLQELAADTTSGIHGYMPNAGYPEVRAKVAEYASQGIWAKIHWKRYPDDLRSRRGFKRGPENRARPRG